MRRPVLAASLALLVAACDTETPDPPPPGPVVFDGVELEARGDAEVAVEGGALVVSGLDGSRSGGFTVGGTPDRVDVEIDPLAIPPGGRFGIEVEDDAGADVASLYNEVGSDGRIDFLFDFPSALGVTAAVVRYRYLGDVLFEAEIALGTGRSRSVRIPTSGGDGEGDTGSTHVIRSGGKYIVVADSNAGGSRRSGGCPVFLVRPPPPFGRQYPEPFCTDWIEVEPLLSAPMPRGTVSVTARGVGTFTVRDLASE